MDVGLLEIFVVLLVSALSSVILICIVLLKTTSPYFTVHRSDHEKQFINKKNGKRFLFPSLRDTWSVHLSVIIPAYDEEKRLPPMLDECLGFLETRRKERSNFSYEVIVVSDGSRDKTVDIALEYTEKYGSDLVRVLELKTNRGKGGAVRLGMMSARGAVLLFADADGATKFSDLTKLEDALKDIVHSDYLEGGEVKVSRAEGVVCGSRAHLEAEALATRSALRNLLMIGFHSLVATLAVGSIRDTQCGFKLFTRASASRLFTALHVQRWAFDVELLLIAEKLDIPLREVAVNWTEIEGSKIVPVVSWLQMGVDLVLIWLRYSLGAWKIPQQDAKKTS